MKNKLRGIGIKIITSWLLMCAFFFLPALVSRANASEANLQAVYVNATAGNDSNTGVSAAQAVQSFQKALSLVASNGTIHLIGQVPVTANTVLNKNLTVFLHGVNDALVVNAGVSFSAGTGYTLTVKADGGTAIPAAIQAGADAVIGDGTYKFDFSALSVSNRHASAAFKLGSNAVIQGSAPNGAKILPVDINLLGSGTTASSKIIRANIEQAFTTNGTFFNIGRGAPHHFDNTTYSVTAPGKRMRFEQSFVMKNNSVLSINSAPGGQHFAIIFATDPQIKDSTIDIKAYGSILMDNGITAGTDVANSIIKTDGIHTPKNSKPFKPVYFADVPDTVDFAFTKDVNIGRITFSDIKNNQYTYGLPVRHVYKDNGGNVEIMQTVPLPAVTLTFQSEDGAVSESFTLIRGTSLEALHGTVSVGGVSIDKSKVAALEKQIEAQLGQGDLDFALRINGDAAKPYQLSDIISADTTVIFKPNNSGVRYYLNDGSADSNHAVFTQDNDGKNVPLTIEEVIAKDAAFNLLRSKNFLGWTSDKEGTQPVTAVNPAQKTLLYAQWKNKKAFNVTYHHNKPAGAVANPQNPTVTATLYEGEHLAGILVDDNENIHLIPAVENGGVVLTGKKFYQAEFGGPGNTGVWNYIKDIGVWQYLTGDFKGLFRTQGWNIQADGSGRFYRGGHTLTAQDFAETNGKLDLYNQWIDLDKLKNADAAAIADPNKARPNIKLAGEGTAPNDYETAAGALVVDHSQKLNYHAVLDFAKLRSELVTLWGRINEVTEWHGTMKAYFDARLDFDQNIKLLFESTWQIPDMTKLAQYGVTDVQQVPGKPTQWIFTISKDHLMRAKIANRPGTDAAYDSRDYSYFAADIPVKIIPKYDPTGGVDFQKLSYEDFMKPMTLTVYDNFDRGINAYITKESANAIALSDKPVLIAGGDIQMNINGFVRQGLTLLKYQLKSPAFDEHARLYPTGTAQARYELVTYDRFNHVLEQLTNPKTNRLIDALEGRAKNDKIAVPDPNNFAQTYAFDIPQYLDKNHQEKHSLVAIKVLVHHADENGRLLYNADGTPNVTTKVYADRFYTAADGKAGNLEEGKQLLSGSFDYRSNVTFVMQYAVPSQIQPTLSPAFTPAPTHTPKVSTPPKTGDQGVIPYTALMLIAATVIFTAHTVRNKREN